MQMQKISATEKDTTLKYKQNNILDKIHVCIAETFSSICKKKRKIMFHRSWFLLPTPKTLVDSWLKEAFRGPYHTILSYSGAAHIKGVTFWRIAVK